MDYQTHRVLQTHAKSIALFEIPNVGFLSRSKLTNGISSVLLPELGIGEDTHNGIYLILKMPSTNKIIEMHKHLKYVEETAYMMNALQQRPFILSLNRNREQSKMGITDTIMKYIVSWIIKHSFSILSIWATWNNLKYMYPFVPLIKNKIFVDGFFLHLSANSLIFNSVLDFLNLLYNNNKLFTLIRIDEDLKLSSLLFKYRNNIPFMITSDRLVSTSNVIQVDYIQERVQLNKIVDESYREVNFENQKVFNDMEKESSENIYTSKIEIHQLLRVKISQGQMKRNRRNN